MTIQDAVYRELKYRICGAGGALDEIVAQDHVKMDMRNTPSSLKSESDYPWLVFRRVRHVEDNSVRFAAATVEVAVIGLRSSGTKGDDLLEEIREALIDHFAGKRVRWGQFTHDGTTDADGGLRASCRYIDTAEAFDENMEEKAHLLSFAFAYLRP